MAGHRRHTANISALRKNIIRREKIFMERNISVFANNALSFLASYIINLNSISELCAARNLHYNYKIISGFHFVTKLQRIVVCKVENYTTSPAGCSTTHRPNWGWQFDRKSDMVRCCRGGGVVVTGTEAMRHGRWRTFSGYCEAKSESCDNIINHRWQGRVRYPL